MPLTLFLFGLLASVLGTSAEEAARAINSSSLWSKYNLIVKPEVSLKPGAKVKVVASSTTVAPAARWDEEEDEESYGPELHDDRNELDEEEDDEDTDEIEEDEPAEIVHTTQRSKGDGGKRKKRPQRKPAQKKHGKGHKYTKGFKGLKKLKKYMFPLLLAYKLKFFTLIPVLLGGLMLIVATTGFAGFFFALFAVGVGLKKD